MSGPAGGDAAILDSLVSVSGTLPLVLQFVGDAATDVSAWVAKHAKELERLLQLHGAILFRGFPISASEDFGRFVSSFAEWRDLPYNESLSYAVRLPVSDRVCTTNEGKTGGMIWHHEQAAAPKYPSRLFFYCHSPATTGGGTGVSPSWTLLEKLRAGFPEFVADCEAKGVLYSASLPAEHDPSKGVGRSWRSFFSVATREEAEERMTKLGYTFTWGDGDVLHMTTPVLSAVRSVPGPRGENTKVFFNQMIAQALANAAEFAASAGDSALAAADATAPPAFLRFGDGSPVPLAPLVAAKRLSDEAAVTVEWQTGDVAMLDNFLVMHARRAFEGPRKLYASLVQ